MRPTRWGRPTWHRQAPNGGSPRERPAHQGTDHLREILQPAIQVGFEPLARPRGTLPQRRLRPRQLVAEGSHAEGRGDAVCEPALLEAVADVAHPRLLGMLRACPRLHLKAMIVDGATLYLGSANWTGAGLGAKGVGRRNFELGIVTRDEGSAVLWRSGV